MRLNTSLGIIAILSLLAGSLRADEVVLKNGHRIQGIIVSDTGERIVLRTQYGTISLRRSQVKDVVAAPYFRRSRPAEASTSPVADELVKGYRGVSGSTVPWVTRLRGRSTHSSGSRPSRVSGFRGIGSQRSSIRRNNTRRASSRRGAFSTGARRGRR